MKRTKQTLWRKDPKTGKMVNAGFNRQPRGRYLYAHPLGVPKGERIPIHVAIEMGILK